MAKPGRVKDNLQLLTLALPGVLARLILSYIPQFGNLFAIKK